MWQGQTLCGTRAFAGTHPDALAAGGHKRAGQFTPITWDAALDEIVSRWRAIMTAYGGEALAGYAYSAHQGLVNRHFTQALFHALGATRVNAAAVCDTCCGDAWELTVGAGGTDPERVPESDLIIVGAPTWTVRTCISSPLSIWRGTGAPGWW